MSITRLPPFNAALKSPPYCPLPLVGVVAGVLIGERVVEMFPDVVGVVGIGVELCDRDVFCCCCCWCCVEPHISTVCLCGSKCSWCCCIDVCNCCVGLSSIFGFTIPVRFSMSFDSAAATVTGDGPDARARALMLAPDDGGGGCGGGGTFESIKDGDDFGVFSEL